MNHKRKGSSTVEIPVWLIVVIFAAIIVIVMNTNAIDKVRKILPFFKNCEDINGKCVALSNCNQLTDNAYMQSTESCKDKSKICCVLDKTSPNYAQPANDASCDGKKEGDSCGDRMVCLKQENYGNLKCLDKCFYCGLHPTDTQCKVTGLVKGKPISKIDGYFSCKCTGAECTDPTGYTCVKNMCSSNTPSDFNYMCCNKN